MEQNNSVLYLLSALCHISTYMRSLICSLDNLVRLRTLSLSSLVEKGSDDKDFKFKAWLSVANAGDSMEPYRRGQQRWSDSLLPNPVALDSRVISMSCHS